MMHPCRNCQKPWAALREGGLCYRCWHWFEYGTVFDEGNRIGSGAAQQSLTDADPDAAEHMTHRAEDWPKPIQDSVDRALRMPSKRPRKGPRT